MSHLSILQHAYDAGFETIWVMEDDIQVMRDPRVLSERIDQLDALVGKTNWDILFTDRDIRDIMDIINPVFGLPDVRIRGLLSILIITPFAM